MAIKIRESKKATAGTWGHRILESDDALDGYDEITSRLQKAIGPALNKVYRADTKFDGNSTSMYPDWMGIVAAMRCFGPLHPKLAGQVKKWYKAVVAEFKDASKDDPDTFSPKALEMITKQCQILVSPQYAKVQIRPSMFGMTGNLPHHPEK